MVGVGRDSKDHLVLTPCHGKDTFCSKHSLGWSSHSFTLCQGLPILRRKDFYLTSPLNLPSFSFKQLPHVLAPPAQGSWPVAN